MSREDDLVRTVNLSMRYSVRRGAFGRTSSAVKALQGVSMSIAEGETVALVGESGSGKSTFGRLLLRLEKPTGGEIWFEGENVTERGGRGLLEIRRRMQIIFQDPYGSLNPRITAGEAISEVLRVHKLVPRERVRERVVELLRRVELGEADFGRYPHEFSGGQRQRIGIARAIATSPRFLVADEPVSALDVSVQAHILQLLARLKEELKLTMLFITHNLAIVERIADRVVVLYQGLIQEEGPADGIFSNPLHPYTRMLFNSIPELDVARKKTAAPSKGADLPASDSLPTDPGGCPFHPRCPEATRECRKIVPPLQSIGEGRRVACLNIPGTPADP